MQSSGTTSLFTWIKGRAQSFVHAARGILLLFLAEWNFRIHLACAIVAIALGVYFGIGAIEWVVLIAAIGLVLCAEALNTAIERAIDLFEPKPHPLARNVKDLAAAAVLVASICAAIIGVILFGPRLMHML
jgi:diacylglycerol kinase